MPRALVARKAVCGGWRGRRLYCTLFVARCLLLLVWVGGGERSPVAVWVLPEGCARAHRPALRSVTPYGMSPRERRKRFVRCWASAPRSHFLVVTGDHRAQPPASRRGRGGGSDRVHPHPPRAFSLPPGNHDFWRGPDGGTGIGEGVRAECWAIVASASSGVGGTASGLAWAWLTGARLWGERGGAEEVRPAGILNGSRRGPPRCCSRYHRTPWRRVAGAGVSCLALGSHPTCGQGVRCSGCRGPSRCRCRGLINGGGGGGRGPFVAVCYCGRAFDLSRESRGGFLGLMTDWSAWAPRPEVTELHLCPRDDPPTGIWRSPPPDRLAIQ